MTATTATIDLDLLDTAEATRSAWAKMATVLKTAAVCFLAFMVLGNLVILGASWWAKHQAGTAGTISLDVEGINNFRVVDANLWRGAAPGEVGYRSLAANGATTVVDLRAEEGLTYDHELLDSLGLDLVRIPMRDGQSPTTDQVERFLAAVRESDGPVFVHCGAGVGRTGAMVAVYEVSSGGANGLEAMRANLSVGPPSLEQLAFAARLQPGSITRPNPVVVATSRLLDAPRRIWHNLGL